MRWARTSALPVHCPAAVYCVLLAVLCAHTLRTDSAQCCCVCCAALGLPQVYKVMFDGVLPLAAKIIELGGSAKQQGRFLEVSVHSMHSMLSA